MSDQNKPNNYPSIDQGFDNLIKDINGDVDYFDSDPSGKYREPPQFPEFDFSFLHPGSSQGNQQVINNVFSDFQSNTNYTSRPMTTIRVDPYILQNCAQDIQSSSAMLKSVSGNIGSCANSAPSIDGQFNSRVRDIASDAIMRGNQLSDTFNGLFGWLDNKARQFLDADFASSSVFSSQLNNQPWASVLKMVFPPLSFIPFLPIIKDLFPKGINLWNFAMKPIPLTGSLASTQNENSNLLANKFIVHIDHAPFVSQFVSQWNIKDRKGDNNCGPASLAMAIRAFGYFITLNESAEAIRGKGNLTGYTDFKSKESINLLDKYGLKEIDVKNMRELKTQLIEKHPVIIAIDNHAFQEIDSNGNTKPYPNLQDKNGNNPFLGNHIVLVTGYETDSGFNITKVFINDPLIIKKDSSGRYIPDEYLGTDYPIPIENFNKAIKAYGSFYASAILRSSNEK